MRKKSHPGDLSLALVRLRGDGGFTLVEVMVVAVMSVIVLGAILTALISTQRAEVRTTAWQEQLQLGEVQEARMVRELRQAYSILSTTPNSVDFLISVSGTQEQLDYECDVVQTGTSYRRCVRRQSTVGGSLPAISTGIPVITNVLDGTAADPVFGFTPDGFNPTYVTIHLEFPASGGSPLGPNHTIVVNDGAYLRNLAVLT
jgi:type II secretory pathway pseudopilin PulG